MNAAKIGGKPKPGTARTTLPAVKAPATKKKAPSKPILNLNQMHVLILILIEAYLVRAYIHFKAGQGS